MCLNAYTYLLRIYVLFDLFVLPAIECGAWNAELFKRQPRRHLRRPYFLRHLFVQITLSFFIINRRQHTVFGVLSGRVVEHLDVIEHVLPCSVACRVGPSPDSFPFQKVKEDFCHRIVMAGNTAGSRSDLECVCPETTATPCC